ncbi:MAG: ubiquinone-dependent pyruvate dehydrogenase [Flavobacteriales bacterium]|nr:ubiquinone-dependent pyruvate dehydrogenase [Flavobacteriales bacterium]MEB2342445.1 thiamine pyrophosphate-binding protein [Flavobacteriia bacterium]
MTVSEYLVEILYNAGVRRIYAVTGDSLNPVNDAVRRDGRLQWIHVRHEEAGAYAASMEAELNGIGCCMGSSGPGHVHLLNGLYDANHAGNPVIAIASTIPSYKLGLQNHQETNVTKLFDDCSKYCFMANTPRQAAQAFRSAIQHAVQDRGVGVVGLPGDVAAAELGEMHGATRNYFTKARILPQESELDALAELLNKNKKIMLFCGLGCKDAQAEVMQLAAVLKAPIGYSYRGKVFFDKEDNPYAVGMNGLLGNKSGFKAMHEAEVMVMLGTDFPYSDFLPEKNTIVQIDARPERLGRRAKLAMGLHGDIKDTLQALLPRLHVKADAAFLKAMRKLYEETQADYERYVRAKGGEKLIHPEYVAAIIDDLADDNAIFTVDTGMSAVWAARYLKGKKGRYIAGSFNHGSMADAMPMALGAGLAAPGRQVISLSGDGGLSMLLGDLMTISQYKIPVKVVVFNNRSLGMVQLEMMVAGYPHWQTTMVNPDFKKVAEAMGIAAWEITECKDVPSVLKEVFAHQGPALVNIYTDPDALAMPPNVDFAQMSGFAETMGKMMLNGRSAEVVDIAKGGLMYLRELV